MYSSSLLDHFYNPRNLGELEQPDGVGEARYHRCGDHLRLWIRLDQDRIQEASFQAVGCGAAIAVGSAGTELLKGRTIDQARQLGAFELNAALGGLPVSKRHALLMFLECLYEALPPDQRSRIEEAS